MREQMGGEIISLVSQAFDKVVSMRFIDLFVSQMIEVN
jgi:hypothetical protein